MTAYRDYATVFKALADEKRLQILNMLAGGEMCACKILECFQITQPTLSYHMKLLTDAELVSSRKEGKWMHYSLSQERVASLRDFLASYCQDASVTECGV